MAAMLHAGPALILVTLLLAIADWVAVAKGNKRVEYVLKPLTLGALLAAAAALRGGEPVSQWVFTMTALVLSLAGDMFLMVPRDLFRAGLTAFLAAHLAYVAAFNGTPPPLLPTLPAGLAMAALGGGLFLRMRGAMIRQGRRGLILPVEAYVLVICAMVTSAVATAGRLDWPARSSALAIAGALSFFVSDALIGWTRFVGNVRWCRSLIMATYHLGQIGLVLGLLG